jgi:predicted transcriptional regulator
LQIATSKDLLDLLPDLCTTCANFVPCQFGVHGVLSDDILLRQPTLRRAHLAVALLMTKAFSIFGAGSRPQLGPFEQQLLQKLWSHGSATVRELLADGKIRQAYTTVMTTVDRLYKKGFLDRVAEGRAFRYTPRQTPEELQRVAALEGIRQLLGSGDTSSLPLSYLVEALSAHDAQLLDELQLLVERKRREIKARGPR